MKRSKKPAAKNSLAPTMKSRAPTKHAIQNEHALAEWAPQLWAADTQKLVRLVRNYRIERVNAATMARGEDGARLGEVEGSDGRVHLVETLATAQKFGIDRADLVEHLAHAATNDRV